jgi:hypothetical protein
MAGLPLASLSPRDPLVLLRTSSIRLAAGLLLLLAFSNCGGSTDINVTGPSLSRCALTATATTPQIPAAGGAGTVALATERECEWTAASESAWLTLTTTKGQGPGSVGYSADANPDSSSRRGSIVVGQQRVDIGQEATPCRYDVVPASITAPAEETRIAIAITTAGGCGWNAQSTAPWMRADPADGTGPGTIQLSIAQNAGPERAATLNLAGVPVSVSQAAPSLATCTYAVAPETLDIPATGAESVLTVTTAASCAWTATADAAWITILENATGRGPGFVRVGVAVNDGARRSGGVVVGGRPVAIVQQAGGTVQCSYSLKPTYYNSGRGPDDVTVQVTATQGCAWSVSGEPAWVTVAEGRSGSGNGAVRLLLAANSAGPRNATLTIAGQPFALSQEGNCPATIKPTYYNAGRGPDEFEVDVTTGQGCAWTATSPVDWARIQSGATGSGNGRVTVHVNPNNDAARSAELTIANQRFTLTQAGR